MRLIDGFDYQPFMEALYFQLHLKATVYEAVETFSALSEEVLFMHKVMIKNTKINNCGGSDVIEEDCMKNSRSLCLK